MSRDHNGFPFGSCRATADFSDIRSTMAINVKLSKQLVEQARICGQPKRCSVPKQIEHWFLIGKAAEENPDLPYAAIRAILIADQESVVSEHTFD